MKNSLVVFGLLIFAVVGCGENNNGYSNNANGNCQVGYSWNGSSCIANNGLNNGYNTGLNGIPQQNCIAPLVWNGTTCTNPQQNGQIIGQQPGVAQIGIAPVQNCPAGQYFNGVTCNATITYQGNCQSGQINTVGYGCAQPASQCQTQYSYLNGSSCMPAPIQVPSCKSVRVRRNGRVVLIRNGCPNDCSGNYGTPKKIKYNRDGSIKKIKW
jgi:hypothetical protein